MLRRVRQCLRDDVVRGHLDRLRRAFVDARAELDRNGTAAGKRSHARQPDRPRSGSRDGFRVRTRAARRARRSCPQRHCSTPPPARPDSGGTRGLGGAQLQSERDEPLLCAVVQVALDPVSRLVGGGDDARAGRRQLGLRLGIRDRSRDKLGELGQTLLRAGRRRVLARRRDEHEAPQTAPDGDRGADGGADAELLRPAPTSRLRSRRSGPGASSRARVPPRCVHRPGCVFRPAGSRRSRSTPRRSPRCPPRTARRMHDRARGAVRPPPPPPRRPPAAEPPPRPVSQRAAGRPAHRRSAGPRRATPRARRELCALATAVATSSVKRASRASVSGGGGSSPSDPTLDRTPQAALDRDRHADRRADAERGHPAWVGLRGIVVESHRAPRLAHQRGHGTSLKPPGLADGQGRPALAASGDERHRVVGAVPKQHRHVGREEPSDLLRDRREDLGRRRRDAATSVATRRSAACSSASVRSSSRACAFAIAVAARSANASRRSSVAAGKGSSRELATCSEPQRRPPTFMGAPTADRIANLRAMAVAALVSSAAYASIRAGRPVSYTSVVTLCPPRVVFSPGMTGWPVPVQEPTERDDVVRLVPDHAGCVDIEQLGPAPWRSPRRPLPAARPRATSVATRRSAACHVGEGAQLLTRLGVRDRGRDQLGEAGELVLDPGREPVRLQRADDHHAPEPALDVDRRAGRGARPFARERGGRGGVVGRVIDARRLVPLEDERRHVRAAETHAAPDEARIAVRAPPAHELEGALGVVPADQRDVGGRDDAADLLGDRREHGARGLALRDERRDATQRRLLARELLELRARGALLGRGRAACAS